MAKMIRRSSDSSNSSSGGGSSSNSGGSNEGVFSVGGGLNQEQVDNLNDIASQDFVDKADIKRAGRNFMPKRSKMKGDNNAAKEANTNVPVDVAENGYEGIDFDDGGDLNTTTQSNFNKSKAVADSYLEILQQRKEEQEEQVSDSEMELRELYGMAGDRGEKRSDLRAQQGVGDMKERLNEIDRDIRMKRAEMDADDMDAMADKIELEGQGTDSRIVNRNQSAIQRERAIQKAAQSADLRARVAEGEYVQGRLENATEQVTQAMEDYYLPIEMGIDMETTFLNRYDSRLSGTQSELAQERRRLLDKEDSEIQSAKDLVISAVSGGYAQPGEIQELVGLKGDPEAQSRRAMEIINRGVRSQRTYDRTQERLDRLDEQSDDESDENEYDIARDFIRDNPNRSYIEYYNKLGETTDLGVSDRKALLEEMGITEDADVRDVEIKAIAKSLLNKSDKSWVNRLFTGRERTDFKSDAKSLAEQIEGNEITINKGKDNEKKIRLSSAQVNKLKDYIDEL